MSPEAPRPGRLLGLVQLVLREGAAFSLPAFRGEWLWPSLVWVALGVAAHASGSRRLEVARGWVALGAGALAGHALLGGIQLVVALAWWLPGARRALTVAAILLVVGGTRLEDVVALPPAGPGEVTVVLANLEMPVDAGWTERLRASFRGRRPDVLILAETSYNFPAVGFPKVQRGREVFLEGVERLGEELGLPHYWLDRGPPLRSGPFQSGTAVLSRVPMRGLPGTDQASPDGAPHTLQVGLQGRILWVTPLHMVFPFRISREARVAALRRVMRRVEPTEAHLLGGDLNSLPLERHDAPLPGYRDAGRHSPFFGGTWPAPLPLARIDAAYVSRALEVRRVRVLPSFGADHRALLVDLAFR